MHKFRSSSFLKFVSRIAAIMLSIAGLHVISIIRIASGQGESPGEGTIGEATTIQTF
jgi:hypothetical protein